MFSIIFEENIYALRVFRRKPGWRFTAGVKFSIKWQIRTFLRHFQLCVKFDNSNWKSWFFHCRYEYKASIWAMGCLILLIFDRVVPELSSSKFHFINKESEKWSMYKIWQLNLSELHYIWKNILDWGLDSLRISRSF